MDYGLYFGIEDNIETIKEMVKGTENKWAFIGNYGCRRKVPDTKKILELNKALEAEGVHVHYISPKTTKETIGLETERIWELLEAGISVSINDWGLFYNIRERVKPEHALYLGRLLTKSIGDWAWGNIHFEKENSDGVEYLKQNNFNHDIKMQYFKEHGIKGVEVNITPESEMSLQNIAQNGFSVIGFADNKIMAVSRSCPMQRLNGHKCHETCQRRHKLVPSLESQKRIYPDLELRGNVIFRMEEQKLSWDGYEKVVYTAPVK